MESISYPLALVGLVVAFILVGGAVILSVARDVSDFDVSNGCDD